MDGDLTAGSSREIKHAFAAIQGLHQLLRRRDAEIAELRASRDELAARLAALERLVGARESGTPY